MTIWLLCALAALLAPLPRPRDRSIPALRWRHGRTSETDGDPGVVWSLALAGELRAGAAASSALQRCGARIGVGRHAAHAARVGGDVPAALRRDAAEAPALRSVAAAWVVSQQTGAGLADVLERIADGRRRSLAVRRELQVELAGPRATARLMSALPAAGVGLAMLLGAEPVRWFFSSWGAVGCLITGLALNGAGFLWINRIVKGIEDRL